MANPKIKLKGWWWKRFFPGYRAQRTVLQALLDSQAPAIHEKFVNAMVDQLKNGTVMPPMFDYSKIIVTGDPEDKSTWWGMYNPDYDPNAPKVKEDKRGVVMSSGDPNAFKIVPSPRIDYCSACKKEHGYECPLDFVDDAYSLGKED